MKKKDAQGPASPATRSDREGRPEAVDRVDERSQSEPAPAAAPEPTSIISPTEVLPEGPGQDPESVTEAIDFKAGGKSSRGRSAGSGRGRGLLDSLPTKATDVGADDTEEVFVILPDGDASLPTVETVVVEEPAWEGTGPTTTDVLKELPPVATPVSPSLEDVPLRKVNPLAEPEPEAPSAADTEAMAGLPGSEPVEKAEGEEVGSIDEIADLAADLDREGPIEAGLEDGVPATEPVPAGAGTEKAGSGRKVRFLAFAASIAALVLVGVFFYPDLQKMILGGAAGGRPVASATGIRPEKPSAAPAIDPDETAARERAASRDAFRSKILLAVEYGLRAEAGKE